MKAAVAICATGLQACFLVGAPVAHATKPCPLSPCENSSGQFERARCQAQAGWIAQGTIADVVHHREGPPTGKDFAQFTFTAIHWEKELKSSRQIFHFTVGWCDNRHQLPRVTSGLFRVFGVASKADASGSDHYLYLEPIGVQAPH